MKRLKTKKDTNPAKKDTDPVVVNLVLYGVLCRAAGLGNTRAKTTASVTVTLEDAKKLENFLDLVSEEVAALYTQTRDAKMQAEGARRNAVAKGNAAAKARQEVFDLRMKLYDLETANATLAEVREDVEEASRPGGDASALLAAAAHADGQRRDLQASVDALREEKDKLEQAIEALKAGHQDALRMLTARVRGNRAGLGPEKGKAK